MKQSSGKATKGSGNICISQLAKEELGYPPFFYVLERKKSVIHSEAFIVVRARSTNSLIHAHIPGLTRDDGTTCRDLLEVDSAVMGE
jgi:hypothetical protein